MSRKKKDVVDEEPKSDWESLDVDAKIDRIVNNAISKTECLQRINIILESVKQLALRLENIELKYKLNEREN